MSKEWMPGDVALLQVGTPAERIGLRAATNDRWHTTGGVMTDETCPPNARHRPLVVIDAEDREQVERLAVKYAAAASAQLGDEYLAWENRSVEARGRIAADLAAALREFTNPTPPKPEEPTGLGAVVEDAEGVLWVRVGSTYAWEHAATDEAGDHYVDSGHYADIAAVRVLSSGVTA